MGGQESFELFFSHFLVFSLPMAGVVEQAFHEMRARYDAGDNWLECIRLDMFCDAMMAWAIYDRFAETGPCCEVLNYMYLLHDIDHSTDEYAKPAMKVLVNKAAASKEKPSGRLFDLWRAYGPLKLDPRAINMLYTAIASGEDNAIQALSVVEVVHMKYQQFVLDAVATLATVPCAAASHAWELLEELSDNDNIVGEMVAQAIQTAPAWHDYVNRIHVYTLRHMLDYLFEHNAQNCFVTKLAKCETTRPDTYARILAYLFDHNAQKALALIRWQRRGLLVCCITKVQADTSGGKKLCNHEPCTVLPQLAVCPKKVWRMVVQFM